MTASPKMDDDEGWALGPEGDADVLAYINQTPALMSLLYDLDLLPEQHPDHETPAWDQIFKITNHWRENSLESRSEVLEAQADVVLHAHTEICDLFAQNSGDYDPSPDEVDRVHDGLTFILGNIAAALKSPRAEPGAPYDPAKKVVEGKPTGPWKDEAPGPASAAPSQTGTPRTDALLGEIWSSPPQPDYYVPPKMIEHARKLERELAEAKQYRNGHLPTCGGIDEAARQCDCGYLQGTAYRELIAELSQAKRDAEALWGLITEAYAEFKNFSPQMDHWLVRADAALAKREGEGKE